MTISANVVCDSVSPKGVRLTTLQLEYPRFIHSEFMTHRAFSRNASSSRAIPIRRMIDDIRKNPATPVRWGRNRAGMQAREDLDGESRIAAERHWLSAMEESIQYAEALEKTGVHKQIVNRLLEPFMHIKVVVTAEEWENFFNLRDHPDAQPEIQELAKCMRGALAGSTPAYCGYGHWHLPYIREHEKGETGSIANRMKETIPENSKAHWSSVAVCCSAARCARVSYLTHDGLTPSVEADIDLFNRLGDARPMHVSPMEHVATPESPGKVSAFNSNFSGWVQLRKILEERIG